MSKLHECLAVEKDLENVASKVIGEAVVSFTKKTELFSGHVRTLKMFDESRKNEEIGQMEVKELTTTVPEKLNYVAEHLVRYYDVLAQKEITNQEAKADVILDGIVFLKNVPATLLLSLENRLTKLREMYLAIPTLQPGVEWVTDPQASMKGVFRATQDEMGLKTEKDFNFRILVHPTKEHPAQVEKWNVDKPVGEYKKIRTSGMVTPRTKSDILKRMDNLIGEIKKARMRANMQEISYLPLGQGIMNYINDGKIVG